MSRIRTHYDNLKVARNAPQEVIRAAYKVLTQKYHPDKNPSDEGAARIMHIINSSYETLSDPERRSAHDLWIANMEREAEEKRERRRRSRALSALGADSQVDLQTRLTAEQAERRRLERLLYLERQRTAELYSIQPLSETRSTGTSRRRIKLAIGLCAPILVVGVLLILAYKAGKVDAGFRRLSRTIPRLAASLSGTHPITAAKDKNQHATAQSAGAHKKAGYVRPKVAPNGLPWPRRPDYLAGSKILRVRGLSSATIDNTRNASDVLARLVAVGMSTDTLTPIADAVELPTWQSPSDVRIFFIPAHSSFTLQNIEPGTYEVRYQDLSQGIEWKGDAFSVDEISSAGTGTGETTARYSKINMVLYRSPSGACTNVSWKASGAPAESPPLEGTPLWNLSNQTVLDPVEEK